MSTGRVLVVGDIMRDIVVRLAGPLRHGTDQRAVIAAMPGGSAANVAAWLAYDGVPVRLLAAVGAGDVAGETARLTDLGVEAALAAHPTLPTGTLIALVGPDGERSFLTDRGANDGLRLPDPPTALFDGVVHLHVSGYACVGDETRATVHALMAYARGAAIPVSLDPGSAGFIVDLGAETMLRWSRGAALCVLNEAEARALTGETDIEGQFARLGHRFPLVVIKRGARGASARSSDGARWDSPAAAVTVCDTIGAGDAFLAGFLAARLAGESVPAALARAVRQGSLAVSRAGGLPPAA